MRPVHCALLLSAAFVLPVAAKLPAPSEEAKAAAAAAAAKGAWNDKVAAYKLCLAQDRAVDNYRKTAKTTTGNGGSAAPTPAPSAASAPMATFPACADPGPFAYTPTAQKPLEASGAHSPAGTATSPPSTNATSAQMAPAPKK